MIKERLKKLKIIAVVWLVSLFATSGCLPAEREPAGTGTVISESTAETGTYEFYWETEDKAGTQAETISTESEETVDTDQGSEEYLKMTVLSVGQGSCTLLESGGETVVIDTADNDYAQVATAALKARNISMVSLVVNTHWDSDHCAGTQGILRNQMVGLLWGPDYETDTRTYLSLMQYISDNNVNFVTPAPGDTFSFGYATIDVLAPIEYHEEENSNCIAMMISVPSGIRVFIGGDATAEEEADILAAGYDLDCDVYLCNHHGSSSSSSEAFVQALSPQYTIISCGKDNDYGHPTAKVLSTLEKTGTEFYRTDQQGDIALTINGDKIEFEKEPTADLTPGIYKGN